MKNLIAALALGFGLTSAAVAAPLITSYDIVNANNSGYGGWNHTYSGKITSNAQGKSNYTGGSGTLNDGADGTSTSSTQLFGNYSAVQITLNLDNLYNVNALSIFGGNFGGNSIPGKISGLSVTIGDKTMAFDSTSFDVNGDFVNLAGSGLDLLNTNKLVLNNFRISDDWHSYMSIGEIAIAGTLPSPANDVPEPASFALLALGAAAVFAARKRTAG